MEGFAYAVAGDSTADADMKRMVIEPDDLPVYLPFGEVVKASDGQPLFVGAPTLTLFWNAIPFEKDADGTVLSSGTVKAFYADWDRARDDHDQRFVFNFFNPLTATWGKHTCVVLWSDWSGKELGTAMVKFTIAIVAIDVDFDTAPELGETHPPEYSEDPVTLGDELVGTIGYGVIGYGVIGEGSNTDGP